MKPTTFAAIALFAASASASAADWQVVHDDSNLGIIGHQNGVAFTGTFFDFDAAISFDETDPDAATIAVVIDMASLDTDNPQRDDVTHGIDLFHVAEFPTAEFTASGFTDEGDGRFTTVGELTIRGVTQEVMLPFELTIDDGTAHAVGEVTINRIDFGVGRGQWASINPVSHEVTITIDIVAEAQDQG